jgi:DNA-binding cell septation regulator SpoVG
MADKPQEPTQQTEKGLEIPVPKRKEVMDAFRKIARPVKKSRGT